MIRVVLTVLTLLLLTLVLLPFQLAGILFNSRLQRIVPHLFHRAVSAIIGIRIQQIGQRSSDQPLLILSNHVSWLDIIVITAVAPVVFVAKHEVAGWPVFGWLAKLQRTIFIERERRHKTGQVAREMGNRLSDGDTVVLFAEGTSSNGNRILPFRSALVGSVHHALGDETHHSSIMVQPLSLAYVGIGGVPTGRALRDKLAWYGDADLMPHILGVLLSGAVDVTVSWGAPVAYDMSADRKQIARAAEASVRQMTSAALRYPPPKPAADLPEAATAVPGMA
ncbi:lysophospholipid acyltransferase family protein [Bradyrhizobium prioriisuperbiae]|uniref:lysophospholipid acyltransferase family protein n=1 Tax=Bradyrhizobium prioriisuperbiae TaxID=2854389 RepID=UPI0028F0D978|nr:lysophospholipid acyltransferase family protein [Bradyrhizobium prioritasuperba]